MFIVHSSHYVCFQMFNYRKDFRSFTSLATMFIWSVYVIYLSYPPSSRFRWTVVESGESCLDTELHWCMVAMLCCHRRPVQEKVRHKRQTLQDMSRPLKQWLYAHKDHPYPTKTDKVALARDSNMTLTQVSNWFANARRRLKNTVKGPDMGWGKRIKLYNSCVEGNQELLSISSQDSMWDSEEDGEKGERISFKELFDWLCNRLHSMPCEGCIQPLATWLTKTSCKQLGPLYYVWLGFLTSISWQLDQWQSLSICFWFFVDLSAPSKQKQAWNVDSVTLDFIRPERFLSIHRLVL